MQNTKKSRKLMSVILVLAMTVTYLLPMSAFAAVTTPTAVATVVENSGGGQTKKIEISFNEEVTLAADTALDTDITVSGKTFGTSTMLFDTVTKKNLIITLADDATVAVDDTIEFSNDKITEEGTENAFNGTVEITGSLACADINYIEIEAAGATITVSGYDEKPTSVGTGTFTYTLTRENYVTKTDSFIIGQDKLGETYTVAYSMEKNPADYTALNAKIAEAKTYKKENYTTDSFATLTTALENAKNISTDLKFDEQATIDSALFALENAINGLVARRTVDFMAVGVDDNVNANYGKATKIVIVFAEPIDATADEVLANLSIKDKIETAEWADTEHTVLNLKLKAAADITSPLEVTYTASNSVKTKFSPAVVDTKTVTAIGNFSGAEELVTATQMAATIVKGSSKPGVSQNDKIIIVFNAPVKNSPATITIDGMNATVVAGTSNTVYQVVLNGSETINNPTTLSYNGMTASLNGSFGEAEVPKALKAYAIDNDGTELVENDEIVVKFNVPTNGANDISKISVKGNGYTASLGASTMSWDSTKTQLKIKLESDAVIRDGVEINLKNLGVKDIYETVNADATSLVLTVEGSFGYTVQPRIVKAMAFSQGTYDYIRVFFNTTVKNGVATIEEPTFDKGFEMGNGAQYGVVDNGSLTYYEVKMNKNAHSALQPGTKIALTGIADKETGSKFVSDTPYEISGAFVSPITPEIQNVVALSNDGSGVAKAGDKIVVIFNTEITDGDVNVLNGKSFGTGYTKTVSGNVVEITLGENPTVEIGSEIKFENFKDKATLSATMETATKKIGGTFGKIIEPEIISATAISNDGSGIPKVGDKIVVVFNTKVEIGGNELFVYEYELKESDNLDDYLVGKTFTVNVKSVSTGISKECEKEITGSYGLETMPNVKSVVLSGANGIETITVVFDRASNKPSFANNEINTLYNNNTHLATADKVGSLAAAWESDTVLKITLASTATTSNTDKLNLSGLGIKSADTGKDVANIDELAIAGTLYPIVTDADIASDGKTIVIKFSARTNGDTVAAQTAVADMKVLFGASATAVWKNNNTELHITMSDDNTMADAAYIVLNSFDILDGFSGTYKVVGQYKIDTASLAKKTLNITSVFVRANNTDNAPREDFTKGLKGDNIVVRFEDITDKAAETDAKANIELVSGEDFGTDYTAVWNDNKTIIITLGENTTVTTASKIKIKDVHFANGTGYLAEGSANEVVKTLTGQFDGRKYWIVNSEKNAVNGRVRVVGMINKADITEPAVLNPFVVCQSYNNDGTVVSINATSITDAVSSSVVFDFDAAKLSKIKLFVLGGDYTDPNAAVTVYSETVEK